MLRRINSPIHSKPEKGGRREICDGYVRAALAEVWEIFDYPCGGRLKPLLESEVDRLRELGELSISDEVAEKLNW